MVNVKMSVIIKALTEALEICRQETNENGSANQDNIILKLYNDELHPSEEMAFRSSDAYKTLTAQIQISSLPLRELIGEENRGLLENYSGLHLLLNDLQSEECFISGFQTATKMLLSGLSII